MDYIFNLNKKLLATISQTRFTYSKHGIHKIELGR